MRAMANVARTNVLRNSQRGEGQNKKKHEAPLSARGKSCVYGGGDFPTVPRLPSVERPEADAPPRPDRWTPFVLKFHRARVSHVLQRAQAEALKRPRRERCVDTSSCRLHL